MASRFLRELLIFTLFLRIGFNYCAENTDDNTLIPDILEDDTFDGGLQFVFSGLLDHDFCPFVDEEEGVPDSNAERKIEKNQDLVDSEKEAMPLRFVIQGCYGSTEDLTTVDGGSMVFSSISEPVRRHSIESNEGIRSKYFESTAEEGESEEVRQKHSLFFLPTVISETVSVASDDEDNERKQDCFQGWSVHRVSMEWISTTFIPYLQSGQKLLPETLFEIVEFVKEIFSREPTILNHTIQEDEELIVVGDIHGQFEDLIRIFEQNGYPSHQRKFIFNGDIVDRGPNSIECLLTLFIMKICHPSSLFITRGNHESHTCGDGTFKEECFQRVEEPFKFFLACHDVFNVLPLGYIIQDRYFVCHGGLPHNFELDMIRDAPKPEYSPIQNALAMALLWNDPHDGLGMKNSKRGGATLSFGTDITLDFLQRHNFNLLIRSHEYHKEGHFFCQDGLCLTIFSAPNYCGIGNKGAVMKIKSDLTYAIEEILVPFFQESLNLRRAKDRSLTLNLEDPEFEFVFPCVTEEGNVSCAGEDVKIISAGEIEKDDTNAQVSTDQTPKNFFWPGFFSIIL